MNRSTATPFQQIKASTSHSWTAEANLL